MTLIACGASYGIRASANSRLTGVSLRTSVAVITCAAVCFRWIRTNPGVWITCPRIVALVTCGAGHGIRARTNTCLTSVGLGTSVAIVASGAVLFRRIRANARGRIARAGVMTLVARRAGNRIGAYANSGLTRVSLGTGIAIVTRTTICLRWI